jgi:predicted aconitase
VTGEGGATGLRLTAEEQRMLRGREGEAAAMAMRVIVAMAEVSGATELIPVVRAHIDGCLYHGPVGMDFAERLAASGGRVRIPTTLNVSALDLLHPERILIDDTTRELARRQMDAYVEMGCQPTWTCAPYQLPDRPAFGEHIAWAESNAIVFANSVLGARTGRYGDFLDICAAITGRVPYSGLHRDENRRAQVVLRLDAVSREALHSSSGHGSDALYGLIGHVVGQEAGGSVPAIVGLPAESTEDQLKALSAASASAGAVGMFHAVGVTPEAPTLDRALGGRRPERTIEITTGRLRRAWHELSTTDGSGGLAAVCLGTPHYSADQLARLDTLLAGRAVSEAVEMYASTGRDVLATIAGTGIAERLVQAGVRIVTDTCTYVTAILRSPPGSTVMTDSAKWAWYAPGNLGVEVVYGATCDCVESAVSGRTVRRPPAWLDG